VSLVIKRAMAEGWADENPVPAFPEMLREAAKTTASASRIPVSRSR